MFLLLVACSPTVESVPAGPPADGHGTVLHVGSDTLLVQHDDLRNRVVPGVERYQMVDALDVKPGDSLDLWTRGAVVERVDVTGTEPLLDGFVAGGVPIEGTVVNVDGVRITLDHEAVPGVMGAMVMGFGLAPWESARLASGDQLKGRLVKSGYGWQLTDPVVTGKASAGLRDDIAPLEVGQTLPRTELVAEDGSPLVLGAGQGVPTALTFIYTRCPDPSFCPAIGARMAALQTQLKRARIVTVTLDPEHDTPPILKAWGQAMGADFETWRLARAEPLELQGLALRAGQHVTVDGGRISHLHRLLILDAEGRLVERYDDNAWPADRVARQLGTE